MIPGVAASQRRMARRNAPPTGWVAITRTGGGVLRQGLTLNAINSLADADGMGTVTYQWYADNVLVGSGSSYSLTQADVGKVIRVDASYTDGRGTVESVAGAIVGPIANVNDAPTGSVTISGTPTEGQTLTASNTLADVDGMGAVRYQWLADGVMIIGATGSNYTLTAADAGKVITVTASYTDGFGTTESATSVGVGPVVAATDPH